MLDFSWERDVQPQVSWRQDLQKRRAANEKVTLNHQSIKVEWKDDSRNLSQLHPRVMEEGDDLPAEGGSFFTFFEHADDPFDVSFHFFH